MISKEDFQVLYRKFLSGNCTPEESQLLEQFRDEFNLDDNEWHTDEDAGEVHARIWQQLQQNMQQQPVIRVRSLQWLKAVAAVIVVLGIGWLFVKQNQQTVISKVTVTKQMPHHIHPGGNNALLVTADGHRLVLNNLQKGVVTSQGGVRVSKTKEGMLTYSFAALNTKAGSQLSYNTVFTPRGGQYEVVLSDGTRVMLNAESSLRFPVSFNGDERRVELKGEAYFEVAKNKAKPFIVDANGSSVRVLGTHFNCNAYTDNDAVTTTLLEGSVRMSKGDESALIVPGQQAVASNNGHSIKVSQADIDATMAWKNGYFIFKDENIVNIMKQVSRWYDVDIVYNDGVQDREFGGTISRYKDINELLNNMQLTHAIHYKIEGRRVVIMR